MARKRTTLKDKNIFKRTREMEEGLHASGPAEEEEETMAEDRTKTENIDTQPAPTEAAIDDLAGLADEAELASGASLKDLPTNEAALDLSTSLSAEAAAATMDDDNFGLPTALETPPAAAFDQEMPIGEADLPATEVDLGATDSSGFHDFVEADLNLPAALEVSADDVDMGLPAAIETMPSAQADLSQGANSGPTNTDFGTTTALPDLPAAMETNLDLPDLPAAMATPPLDLPSGETSLGDIPDLPVGEAGLADTAALPFGEAGFELPQALPTAEAGLDLPQSLPAGEASLGPADTFPTTSTISSGVPSSPFESAAPTPLDTATSYSSRPVPPSVATSLPVPPQTSGGTFAVSRTTPLTLGDDSPRDIFDFMGVADEPKTITYQIPEDIEELTPEERKRRMMLLKDNRIREQFDKVYQAIEAEYQHLLDSNISSNKEITDWSQNLLAETRYILMNYQIEHLAKAEWNIQQVKARIDRAEESEKWRQKWGWLIIIWGVVWFFIFVILIFNPDPLLFLLQSTSSLSYLVPAIFLRTLFFGGIGGVTSVFYSLLNYVSTRQYDKEYNFSYFTKPFMGMIVGTLVYLMLYVVAPIFNIVPQGASAQVGDQSSTFEVLTYFFAIAAGFKENVAFALLSRLMKLIFRDERTESTKIPEAAPPPGPFSSA